MAWIPIVSAVGSTLLSSFLNNKDKQGGPGAGTNASYEKVRVGSKKAEKFQNRIFNQQGIPHNKLYRKGSKFLENLYSNNPEQQEVANAPYIQNFNEQIVPDIANRFAGMGTGASGLSSSGFQQTLAQAGRGLQTDLAAMRQNQQSNNLQTALQYAQTPYENQKGVMNWNPYQTVREEGQPGMYNALAQQAPNIVSSIVQGLANKYSSTPSNVTPTGTNT
jgi:hypothetical protein